MNYLVYRHRNTKTLEVFYVGSGAKGREKGVDQYKNSSWHSYVKEHGDPIVEVVAEGLSKDDALDLEYLMINEYGTLLDNDGLLTNIQRGRYKNHWSTNIKIGKASKGNTHCLGIKHSEETKAKVSKALLGRKFSEESRAKLSISLKGNTNSLGNKRSEEAKLKISLIMRRKHISDDDWINLEKEIYNIDKIIRNVTYKELSIKYNVKEAFIGYQFRKIKKNRK